MANGTTRTTAKAVVVAVAAALAACGGGAGGSGKVGPEGGSVSAAGVTVAIPAGALAKETEISVTELPRREGEGRRVHVGPDDAALAAPVTITMRSDDGDASDERMVEIEHGPEGEIEHGIETERHDELEHGREAEVRHLGELELRHARVCLPGCDAGFECDDGICKLHPEDPVAPAPTSCPVGMELDVSDGICKPHPEDPVAAPAPTSCPDGMELDVSDGICKPHGGSGGGSGSGA